MSPLSLMRPVLLALLVILALSNWGAEARYLPTRSQDDRLERLRELIKDLLDTELEKPVNSVNNNELFERKLLYKREAVAAAQGASSGVAQSVASAAGQMTSTHPRAH